MQYPASSCQPSLIRADPSHPPKFSYSFVFCKSLPKCMWWWLTPLLPQVLNNNLCLLACLVFIYSHSPVVLLQGEHCKLICQRRCKYTLLTGRQELSWTQNCRGGKSIVDQFSEGLASSHRPDEEDGKPGMGLFPQWWALSWYNHTSYGSLVLSCGEKVTISGAICGQGWIKLQALCQPL